MSEGRQSAWGLVQVMKFAFLHEINFQRNWKWKAQRADWKQTPATRLRDKEPCEMCRNGTIQISQPEPGAASGGEAWHSLYELAKKQAARICLRCHATTASCRRGFSYCLTSEPSFSTTIAKAVAVQSKHRQQLIYNYEPGTEVSRCQSHFTICSISSDMKLKPSSVLAKPHDSWLSLSLSLSVI